MREQKANDNGFPVVGKQVKEQQTFPFDQLVKYDGATNKITINANVTINGDINSNGSINASDKIQSDDIIARNTISSMERLIDANGNFRFVEGNGTVNPNLPSGINITYNKWSLSGSHLMIVCAGTIANGVEIPNGVYITRYILPSYIINKIVPIITNKASIISFNFFNSVGNSQAQTLALAKFSTGIQIEPLGNFITSDDRNFRIQFDLLIDAE